MLYAPIIGLATIPLSELMLTTRPFDSSISGANAFVMRYGP